MLKFLSLEEKLSTKDLWANIFNEDSSSFIDYYYTSKIKNNKILVKFLENKIISMLHLNPYTISFNNKLIKSYYIVGVATDVNYRKKGYMRELLVAGLRNMNEEKVPFTFLMPAKEEIYLPFAFNYIYVQKYLKFKENLNLKKISITSKDYEEVSNFLNTKFKSEYNLFTIRDKEYIKNLHNELKSENGDFLKVFLNNKCIGYYLYWGIEKREVRSIYSYDEYTEVSKKEPKIMARIVNLKSFLEHILLHKNICEEKIFYIQVKDTIIKENSNTFKWSISNKTSNLEACNKLEDLTNVISLDISDLTSWIFSYIPLSNLIKEGKIISKNKNILQELNSIKTINNIFLDEIV